MCSSRAMARLRHRVGLMALLAILVTSSLTLADHSADRNGTASDATSIKDEQYQSNQTRVSSPGFLVNVDTSKTVPNQQAAVGTPIKPSPVLQVTASSFSKPFSASAYLSVGNTGLDYDLADIFGENAVFDFPSGSAPSTQLVSSVVESKKTKSSNDHPTVVEHSVTSPGHAPLAEFGKTPLDSLSTTDEMEPQYIEQYLPNGEPFHTPPPLSDDSLDETNSEDHYAVIESPYQSNGPYFVPGRSIPKVVNKPASPDVGYTHSVALVDQTPVSQRPFNYPPNVQTEQISVTILNTASGSLQVGAPPRHDYGAPPRAGAPLNSTYSALLAGAPVSSTYGAPPQAGSPLSSVYRALPQASTLPQTGTLGSGALPRASAPLSSTNGVPPPASAPFIFDYGAPPSASAPLNSPYRAFPQAGALSSTNGTPPYASNPLSATYGVLPQAGNPVNQAYDASRENHSRTVSNSDGVSAGSYTYEMPHEDVKVEAAYSGFLSTLWRTGSPREAAAGYASDLWNRFTKGVGIEAAKKSKIILSKAAPFVKKVVGAKAVESLFQSADAETPEINGVGAPVVTVVGEFRVPSDAYGAPPTVLGPVTPQAPVPSYKAIHPDPQTARGEQQVLLAVTPSSQPAVANKPENYVQPHPLASGETMKYHVEGTAKQVVPSPPTKYSISEPIKNYAHAPKQPEVVLQGPTIFVGETRPFDPAQQHPYPAAPVQQYNPLVQFGAPSDQLKAVQSSVLNFQTPQAQKVQNYPYLPPQAFHLIRNQGDEQQAVESVTTRSRQGIFAIFDKAREGYNTVYNTIEYGRNLTNQATTVLGGFWPGNWFRSSNAASQLGESPAAPAAVSIVSSYASPVVVPVSNPDKLFHYPPNYQYYANYDAAQYPGYVVRSGLDVPQGPVAHSYIAALSGPVVQGEEGEPNRF